MKKTFSTNEAETSQFHVEPIKCDPENFVTKVLSAGDDGKRANGYIAGALSRLKLQRLQAQNRLDHITVANLSFLALKKPSLFCNDPIRHTIYGLIRSDVPPSARLKGQLYREIVIFAINLLWSSHRQLSKWPLDFVRIYVEDSCKNRDWVDHKLCATFAANIRHRFNTREIPDELKTWTENNVEESQHETPQQRFEPGLLMDDQISSYIVEKLHQQRSGLVSNINLAEEIRISNLTCTQEF